MTRINSAIPVKFLTDEMLLAEHREIKRLPYVLAKSIKNGSITRKPKQFCLGTGHVLFFLDKMLFVLNRYNKIRLECLTRGFNVQNFSDNFSGIDAQYFSDYMPTKEEQTLLINRITDRINNSKKDYFHYNRVKITKKEACDLLKVG